MTRLIACANKSHKILLGVASRYYGRICFFRPRPRRQRRKVWLTPTTRVMCSNAAKTRNPLKFTGVPQTRQQISAVSRPEFTILLGHVEEALLFNKFFPIVDTCLSCEDTALSLIHI